MQYLILLDDGTTASQSLATLVKVQSHYPKLKVIQTQNQGVAAAVIRWQRSPVVHTLRFSTPMARYFLFSTLKPLRY